MPSPLPSTVVIACPHCGTRYQLPPEAIGPRGRRVSCAHCGETWKAEGVSLAAAPGDPDTLFDEAAERELDAAFAAAERAADPDVPPELEAERQRTIAEIKAAIAPRPQPEEDKPDPVVQRKRERAFSRRQAIMWRQLPLAKVRRVVRLIAVSMLLLVIVGGVAFRGEIVRQLPDLAGVYEALGMGVNVLGLEFRDVTTLVTHRSGGNVMQVDGRIYSVAGRAVSVPPVLVTLLDAHGAALYQWRVASAARELEPGEVVDFTAQLSSPPAGAARVRLTFDDGIVRSETPITQTATASK
ncbi:MAG TPA: hypothetical protein GYA10_16095 [Alphaproteobacteria bacterium]|nr:hypothetical protein [Alphaproteobacteria bacterium]